MGQKKQREKTADELQAERVTAALEQTDRTGRAPAIVRENPGQFLRDMYEVWHRQGGKEGGRWRNSIRKMRDEWLVGRNAVPSLHPKLMGRVKVTRSDARALVDLFLGRWRYAEPDDQVSSIAKDGYVAFATTDRRRLRNLVVASIIKTNEERTGLFLPEQGNGSDVLEETERRWVNVEKVTRECDALITLSRHKIAVGSVPWQTIRHTWNLVDSLYEYDKSHASNNRLFIWAIDLGSREADNEEAFEEYFNAGLLALQLASFGNFDKSTGTGLPGRPSLLPRLTVPESARRVAFWRWLVDRTIIVGQNLRLEEIEGLYSEEHERISEMRLKDIGVTAEHILPSTTPRVWGRELRHLYGKEIAASDATFTVFMRDDPWIVDGQSKTLRYFAHTPVPSHRLQARTAYQEAEGATRSEELQSPDRKHDHAFRLIYWAARYRLGRTEDATQALGLEALAYLRKIGFTVLTVPDFLSIFGKPGRERFS